MEVSGERNVLSRGTAIVKALKEGKAGLLEELCVYSI